MKLVKQLVLAAATLCASQGMAQGLTYIGRFTYSGGTEGGTRSADAALPSVSNVRTFAIDATGPCSLSAQVLHTSPTPLAPTRLISVTRSPSIAGANRYTYSVNNGFGGPVVGIRGFMNGYAGYYCTGYIYVEMAPTPVGSLIVGTVDWVSNIATGNGATNIRVRTDAGNEVMINIIGVFSDLPQTQIRLRTVQYLQQLLNHRVSVNGTLIADGSLNASVVQEL